jgi:GNAT superfamily N-acetyltransferase
VEEGILPATTLTIEDLRRGFPGPGNCTLRLARSGDGATVLRLAELAGTEPPAFLGRAVDDDAVGGFTLASLLHPDGDGPGLAPYLTAPDFEGVHSAGTTILVAQHPDGSEPVGACILSPPTSLLQRFGELDELSEHALAMTLIGVRKLVAVAVEPGQRRQGLGRTLLELSTALAFATQITTVFGQIRTDDGLGDWYRRSGYTVFDPAEGLDLSWLYSRPTAVGPQPGEQMIAAMPGGQQPRRAAAGPPP